MEAGEAIFRTRGGGSILEESWDRNGRWERLDDWWFLFWLVDGHRRWLKDSVALALVCRLEREEALKWWFYLWSIGMGGVENLWFWLWLVDWNRSGHENRRLWLWLVDLNRWWKWLLVEWNWSGWRENLRREGRKDLRRERYGW
ncbi:unnamed protein product [Dovyalis caffra]|uniref:Uncharacterized protein n=1 Tax=Dovyalis caffra TaxID=77055 RepID=A0AAV1RAK0_9ROSI|nr:unnamed protein product [Dovyalis caffra]